MSGLAGNLTGGFRGGSGGSLEPPPPRTKLLQFHGGIHENSGKMLKMNTLLMDFNLPEILDPLLNLNPFSRIMIRMIYVSFVGLGMRNLKLLDSLHCHQDQAQNAHCISVDCDTGTVYCATDTELLGIDPRTGEVNLHAVWTGPLEIHLFWLICEERPIFI